MTWLRVLLLRLMALFRKGRLEQELDEELRSHLEMVIEENVRKGMSPQEARYAAMRRFGGVEQVKEVYREQRGIPIIETLWQDIRYGLRQLQRSPEFTAAALLILALGIGANIAIFSLINAVLLKTLPVRDPAQLVVLGEPEFEGRLGGTPGPGPLWLYSYPLYERLRAQNHMFQGIAAQQSNYSGASVRWTGASADGAADFATGRCVALNYFEVLGVSAFKGRTFGAEDDSLPGANPVIVLSHGYWQKRFGTNPALLGGTLIVNGSPFTVVGITPPGFTGTKIGSATDFWVPISMQAQFMRYRSFLADRNQSWLYIIGRLKPGISLAQAQASVNITLQQFLGETPVSSAQEAADRRAVHIDLYSGAKGLSLERNKFRQPLLMLMAGVALLLLIACVNVSHLLLARAISRHRELSLRMALGASRTRLLRQLLTEGLLLSALGGLLGALIAGWLSQGLLHLAETSTLALDVSPDARVMIFTAVVTLGTTVLFGLAPAWQSSGVQLNTALKESARGITGTFRRRFGRLLLVFQVALSMLLLVGAGLLVRSLQNLKNLNKGFEEEHALLVEMSTRMTGMSREQSVLFYDELLGRVTALPEVQAASLSLNSLLSGNTRTTDLAIPGYAPSRGEDMEVVLDFVTPAYFDAVGMSLARGRRFTRADGATSSKVAIVNEAMAWRFFRDADVLGKRFRMDSGHGKTEDLEIVGVVKDAKIVAVRQKIPRMVYVPVAQSPEFLGTLEVRTTGDPGPLASQIRKIVLSTNSTMPVTRLTTLSAQVERSLAQERLIAELSSAFGLLALLLVSVGLYGVLSQAVVQRSNEIGVRMALGASQWKVQWMVLREALLLVLVGMILGIPSAVAAGHLVTSLLFGLTPADPITLIAAGFATLSVAMLASYLPARRASSVDPIVALRHE